MRGRATTESTNQQAGAPQCLNPLSQLLKKYTRKTYIYFLLQGDEVVYVGQTQQLDTRINAGHRKKKFSSVFYFEVPPEDLHRANKIERAFINYFKPRLCSEKDKATASWTYEWEGILARFGFWEEHLKYSAWVEESIKEFYPRVWNPAKYCGEVKKVIDENGEKVDGLWCVGGMYYAILTQGRSPRYLEERIFKLRCLDSKTAKRLMVELMLKLGIRSLERFEGAVRFIPEVRFPKLIRTPAFPINHRCRSSKLVAKEGCANF